MEPAQPGAPQLRGRGQAMRDAKQVPSRCISQQSQGTQPPICRHLHAVGLDKLQACKRAGCES